MFEGDRISLGIREWKKKSNLIVENLWPLCVVDKVQAVFYEIDALFL